MSARAWIRQSTGGIVDGRGWEIHRDSEEALADDGNLGLPWSLWHHGEYVGNYATVVDAKADAVPVDCSKCGPSLRDFPVGSYVRRLYDNAIGLVVAHQPRRSSSLPDALTVEIDGEEWSGTLQAWESITQAEALATLIRTSIETARADASATFAQYIEADERDRRSSLANRRVAFMWRTFYDINSQEG
jgi:hypothetical protein